MIRAAPGARSKNRRDMTVMRQSRVRPIKVYASFYGPSALIYRPISFIGAYKSALNEPTGGVTGTCRIDDGSSDGDDAAGRLICGASCCLRRGGKGRATHPPEGARYRPAWSRDYSALL